MAFDGVMQDVRFAMRQLRRNGVFTLGVIATLALGIGANSAMVGTIDRLVVRAPPHVRDAGSLVQIYIHSPGRDFYNSRLNYPTLLELRSGAPAFEGVVGVAGRTVSLGEGADAEYVNVAGVTGEYFQLLGVHPLRGRFITQADDSIGSESRVVVISEGLWRRRFGSSPRILGERLRIGAGLYDVVGVAPGGFEGIASPGADAWLPLSVAATHEGWMRPGWERSRGSYWLAIAARIAPSATRPEAEAQANTVFRRTASERRSGDTRLVLGSIIPGLAPDRPREVRVSFWLTAVSALVLLIACINVANLLLARTIQRHHEVALRAALGASTARLLRQFFIESLLLSTGAGIVALALVAAMSRVLRSFFLAGSVAGFVDTRVLLIGAGITTLASLAITVAPWMQVRAHNLVTALQQRAGATAPRRRAQMVLLGVQASLAAVMLIGAGLFGRSLQRVQSLDLGVDLDQTIVASVELRRFALSEAGVSAIFQQFVERVRALPSVVDATVAASNPYMSGMGASPWVPGTTQQATWEGRGEVAYSASVGPRFFSVTGASSLNGRDFTEADRSGSEPVVIINRPLERRLFGDGSALGKCVKVVENVCARVVGVLNGVFKFNVLDREKMSIFYPLAQDPFAPPQPGMIVARARGNPDAAIAEIRRAMQTVRPDLPAARVRSMREFAEPQFLPWRMGAVMLTIFGGIALLLAGAGLYSVAMYVVTQRSREFAVRIALGAETRHVARAAVQGELVTIVVGVALGALVTLGIARWTGPLLYQTSPTDPWVIATAATLMAIAAAMAVMIPVRRALRIDPAKLMRLEQ